MEDLRFLCAYFSANPQGYDLTGYISLVIKLNILNHIMNPASANYSYNLPVEPQQPVELRRSGRTTRKPSRYLLLGESYKAITIDSEEDPVNYKEALEDVDAQE